MSNPVQPVQGVSSLVQPQLTAPPAKAPRASTTTSATPQDKVTISPQARQALASKAKPAAGGDVDHDGDRH